MPDLRPFQGIRYSSSSDLAKLVCPPYDVIPDAERQRLHEVSPYNAIRLELAHKDAHGGYSGVEETFARWLDDGVLRKDESDSFYVYRQDFTGSDGRRRRVAGLIGALGLEPFGSTSGVLPHERTMPGPKEDRLSLMRACPVNFSPIYSIYRGGAGLAPYLEALENRPPAARFAGSEEILHRLWKIDAPAEIEMLRNALKPGPLVIADGHHRYETALTFHAEQLELAHGDSIMCFCVDADSEDLVVLPYHRVIRADADPVELEKRATEAFGARSIAAEDADQLLAGSSAEHAFVFLLAEKALLIELDDERVRSEVGDRAEAWRRLSVVALHEVVLPLLLPKGVEELRFTRDPDEVRDLVDSGGWTTGVLLRAIAPEQIVDVAASGERMPQKASYFWPKAITGLVFHSLR